MTAGVNVYSSMWLALSNLLPYAETQGLPFKSAWKQMLDERSLDSIKDALFEAWKLDNSACVKICFEAMLYTESQKHGLSAEYFAHKLLNLTSKKE